MTDDDCEDQGYSSTKVCSKWQCQEWRPGEKTPWHPELILKGIFWCCPKCGGSYGENPHPDCPSVRVENLIINKGD